jgi:hypothetical protein
MPRVKIKQMDERVATNGLHMGGGPERRKLQPGEVIDISEDFLLPDGRALLDVMWETKKLEMTLDPASRPLDYLNYREATLCAPQFKPRDPSEENERNKAREAVALRMSEAESEAVPPIADSPAADDTLDDSEPEVAAEAIPPTATNRRAERRAALQAATRGAAIST